MIQKLVYLSLGKQENQSRTLTPFATQNGKITG